MLFFMPLEVTKWNQVLFYAFLPDTIAHLIHPCSKPLVYSKSYHCASILKASVKPNSYDTKIMAQLSPSQKLNDLRTLLSLAVWLVQGFGGKPHFQGYYAFCLWCDFLFYYHFAFSSSLSYCNSCLHLFGPSCHELPTVPVTW